MKAYYFTFKSTSTYSNCFQQIITDARHLGELEMTKQFSTCWNTCYTQEEFAKFVQDDMLSHLKPLPPIYIQSATIDNKKLSNE